MKRVLSLQRFIRAVAVTASAVLLSASGALAGPPSAMGGGLQQLVAAWELGDPRLTPALDLFVKDVAKNPMVELRLSEGTSFEQVSPELSALGFKVSAVSVQDSRRVEGYLPLGSARAAVSVRGVDTAHAVLRPIHNAGSVQSQAVALQKADLAQARGFDGSGIRIGVLSDSYNTCAGCSTHAAQDIASGDLPAGGVSVLQDDPGGSDEGRAMLQLVHDIAPAATLGFATAFSGEVGFANNILALRSVFKADVIVDDVIYFDEPFYSDGIIAQAVDVVSRDGAAYFSSAGNNGLEAFEARYRPVPFDKAKQLFAAGAGNIKLDTIPPALRPLSIHNFSRRSGGDRDDDDDDRGQVALSQTYTTAATNFISFQWDEPFGLGKVKTDYNIYVFDANGNWQDPFSAAFPGFYTTDDNTATDQPFEILVLPPFPGEIHGGANVSDYQIVIGNFNGGPARRIKYVNINGLGVSERQAAPSVFGHAAARGGQAVAATWYAIPNFPEDYSAAGPVSILFDTAGNRLHHSDVRQVPQITAADGVDTTFFGFDADGNGHPNFFGTSAAAPDAAATAALVLQAAGGPGSLSPRHLYRILQRTATPIRVPDDRSWAAAFTGPVLFNADGDWTRWSRYFGLSVRPFTSHSIQSISFNTAGTTGLVWSATPNRFHIGASNGITLGDITRTRSVDGKTFTLTFAPGKFHAGSSFRFGMSVFNSLQGSTQEDPDRLRGTVVNVTLDNGRSFTSNVFAAPPRRHNRFTGAGLVNADLATLAAASHHDDDDDRDDR
jgi:hypothetical protein